MLNDHNIHHPLSFKTKSHISHILPTLLQQAKNGHDHRSLQMQITKFADTRNIKLKKLINEFLLLYNDPQFLLIVTNTTLKDLNDIDPEIVLAGLQFVIKTNYLDEFFIKNIVRLLEVKNDVLKKNAICALGRFFDKNEWVMKYELKSIFKKLVLEECSKDILMIVYRVFDRCDVLEDDIWVLMVKNYNDQQNIILSLIMYKKIKKIMIKEDSKCNERIMELNKKEYCMVENMLNNLYDVDTLEIVDQLMKDTDVGVMKEGEKVKLEHILKIKEICYMEMTRYKIERIYIACKILVLVDNSTVQEVFDYLVRFSKYNTKKSYVILRFLRELIINFDCLTYENKKFAIFEGDSLYIKRMKINILGLNIDSLSEGQLHKCIRNKHLSFDILNMCLWNKFLFEKNLEDCLNENKELTVNILHKNMSYPEKFRNLIFNSLIDLEMSSNENEEKLIYILCYTVNDDNKIRKIFEKRSVMLTTRILSTLLYINKISKETFEEHNLMKNSISYLLDSYGRLKLEKDTSFNYKPDDKIFTEYKYKSKIAKYLPAKITNDIILYTVDEDIISLQLIADNTNIYINVIRIEEKAVFIIQNETFEFSKVEKIVYKKISSNFISEKLQITFQKSVRNIFITLMDWSMPFICNLKEFNANFAEIDNYEIFAQKYFDYKVTKIDENSFTFMLFNAKFYGISLGGQVILKSMDMKMLQNVSVAIREGYYK